MPNLQALVPYLKSKYHIRLSGTRGDQKNNMQGNIQKDHDRAYTPQEEQKWLARNMTTGTVQDQLRPSEPMRVVWTHRLSWTDLFVNGWIAKKLVALKSLKWFQKMHFEIKLVGFYVCLCSFTNIWMTKLFSQTQMERMPEYHVFFNLRLFCKHEQHLRSHLSSCLKSLFSNTQTNELLFLYREWLQDAKNRMEFPAAHTFLDQSALMPRFYSTHTTPRFSYVDRRWRRTTYPRW